MHKTVCKPDCKVTAHYLNVGPFTAVACGDYASGTNHALPTAGYARMYSGLNVDHFCKTSTIQMTDREGLEAIGDIVETLADA